jgi:putative transposase
MCLVHCVFSTKGRRKLLVSPNKERIWSYIKGIARHNSMNALAVGGTDDHIHVLLSIPATITIAKAIRLIKGGSSKWIHETFPALRNLGWQEGYASFSVSISRAKDTIDYINRQAEHHRKKTFEEEYRSFLKRHGIEFDEKYLWG